MPDESAAYQWIPAAVSVVGAAVSCAALAVSILQRRRAERLAADREYARIANSRERFWTPLRAAYVSFRAERADLPSDLDALISASGTPPRIPRPSGSHLRTWADENQRNLAPDQRALWEFCSAIYPPRDGRGGSVTDHSLLAKASAESFHQARGDLARFWHAWIPAIGLRYAAKRFDAARLQVMILSWLECALVLWTQDDGEGKGNLFQLAVRHSRAA